MTQTISIKGTVGYALAQACKLHRQRAEELLTEIGLHVGRKCCWPLSKITTA